MKHLGEYLDIHCGGIDNAFPHHTNEIAQSEAYLGHEWCNFWFHILHLNTNDGKMSKSKGEFLTVSLLEEKGYLPVIYRFFCLLSHYRKALVFSYENLDNAKAAYEKLIAKISKIDDDGEIQKDKYIELKNNFTSALDNDLNTSLSITALYDVIKSDANGKTKRALLSDFDKVLGLDLIENADKLKTEDEVIPQEIMALIEERSKARSEKNFAKADELRDIIQSKGYIIEETRQGTKITRK